MRKDTNVAGLSLDSAAAVSYLDNVKTADFTVTRTIKKKNTYHHGDLREALLAAAEKILRRKGLAALTLRAIAREAGVSHGAPAHHFRDLTDLLSELAAVGFRRLEAGLRHSFAHPDGRDFPGGRAYLSFSTKNPDLFALMYRDELLDSKNPSLGEARKGTLTFLFEVLNVPAEGATMEQLGALTARLCVLLGFSVLVGDGLIKMILRHAPPGTQNEKLLIAAMSAVTDAPV